jgi:hypothetical protein
MLGDEKWIVGSRQQGKEVENLSQFKDLILT